MSRIKLLLAALPIVGSLLTLAMLLAISTQPGDAAARRLDLALRQANELAPRIVSLNAESLAGAGLTDLAAAITELDGAFAERLDLANEAFATLYPENPAAGTQARQLVSRWFDAIDIGAGDAASAEALRSDFAAVNATAAVFRTRTDAVRRAHARWQRLDRFVESESRGLVGDLRSRGADDEADRIFGAVQQLRERLSRTIAVRPAEADQIVSAMAQSVVLADPDEASRLRGLVAAMRDLRPSRGALRDAEEALADSPLPGLLTGLREQVAAGLLQRSSTIGDARVLLNVYTASLLLVLVYFGLRLRGSYAELGRSYEQLEVRVEERTRDLVRANEELKESQVQLVQAEKMSSLGQLVAGVMHEINTPLMYVRSNVDTCADNITALAEGFSPAVELASALRQGRTDKATLQQHLLAMKKGIDPEEIDLSLEEITQLTIDTQEGLEQISELVQSLKDFSRLDRADEDRFDVREGLEKTLTITRNLLKYGVEVVKDFGDVPRILCAPSRLNQVFINMVTNAVQAMDGEGRLELATRDLGDAVQVVISDTGCGIPPEHLSKITDPFFTTKPVGEGTGLGMSIVRQIIDEHGGELDIASEVGVGTVMTVTLPVERAPRDSAEDFPAEEAA
ncbi:MAG: ATP-binding protein [Pseudomonadales bacterium]|jgi:signal transduction histidine kinase|nr:ATP-binding protein [Pseudomonadales bacterium]